MLNVNFEEMSIKEQIEEILLNDFGSYDDYTVEKLLNLHGVSKTLPTDAIIKSGELNGVDFIDEDIKDWEESDIETFEEYLEKYY